MEEIEVKILEVDRKELEKKLVELGAKKVFDDEMIALFYDFDDYSIKNAKTMLRLRKEGKDNVLCFKRKISKGDAKIMEEIETTVTDFEGMKSILKNIGLNIVRQMRKKRVSYKLNNTKIEFDKYLDEYDYIPEFLEIEGESVEALYETAKLIGYTKEDCTGWTATDLINHYSTN